MLRYFLLLICLANYVDSNITSTCVKKEIAASYLEVAIEMINKAKANMPANLKTQGNLTRNPTDCADILLMGHRESGVYTIQPMNRLIEDKPLDVYCDMDTDGGGWTMIQRRGDYGNPNDYFFKEWKGYKEGFGDIQKEFWLGNDNIFALTNQKLYTARFDLEDVEFNKKYALYGNFWIDDEFNNYTLHIEDYSGNAGDSMIVRHNNQKFSTNDVDNDNDKGQNCALHFKGGWWYNTCRYSNLNGLYFKGVNERESEGFKWYKYTEALEGTEIKIRPKKFISTQ